MKTLYLIGGPMGVGKTTVCQQLKKELPDSVFLDGDWCWDADPFQVTEETKRMVLENICFLLNQFLRCSAYENVIFCWVLDRQAVIDEICLALDLKNCTVRSVSLLAGAAQLRARLEADVAAGKRTADVVGRSLARLPLYPALHTIQIDPDGKSVRAVVREIMVL